MSLKWFHILFITVALILAVGVGIWGIVSGGTGHVIVGALFLLLAVLIVIYERWFLRKTEGMRLE